MGSGGGEYTSAIGRWLSECLRPEDEFLVAKSSVRPI